MSLKPADTLREMFTTYDTNTGGSSDADNLPTAVLTHNGVDDEAVSLRVTEIDTGRYIVTGTIPSSGYASGDTVHIWVAATVGGIAAKAVIACYVLDGKRVSDLQDASVAAIQGGLGTSAEIAALQAHGDGNWTPDNSDVATILGDVATTLGGEVAAIKAKTDNLPAQPAAIGSQMDLVATQDIYPADVEFVPNDTASCDEYTVAWFHNGTPLTTGITAAMIEVTGRSDGSDLVAAGTAMSAVGSSGVVKYDEPTHRLSPGDTAIVTVSATIDGATRTWRRLVMRADS